MAPIRLVIFDCDGVLVDSEPLAMRVLLAAIEKAGVVIAPETGFRSYLGRSFASVARSLARDHGLSLDDAAVDAMRLDLYDTYRRELKPMPGLVDMLPRLGLPFCVASSSQMDRIAVSLEVTGLAARFHPAIYSATMVDDGKPAPDLFLHTAAAMGVPPEECLVIEDSPAGIIAARKAGMRVFAFMGGGHIGPSGLAKLIEALRPDDSFTDMADLPRLVAQEAAKPSRRTAPLLVAVDVGTGSARAGVLTATGTLLARDEAPIAMRRPDANHAEHDSEQIWSAVCAAVRGALSAARADPAAVAGIAFDATCSLVVRDEAGAPLPVGDGGAGWDTLVWLDHRSLAEAAECTSTGDPALDSIGGVMSPEMEVPKLMWLKRHRPDIWARAGLIFDLADFLAWKATGSPARSTCTLTCKWTWIGAKGGWQPALLDRLGLSDLPARAGIVSDPVPVGTNLGQLTEQAATALGLTTDCRVGAGLIDAHAGALGSLGAFADDTQGIDRHLVLVAGTSSCVMALSPDPRPIHGVWGPFENAVLPDTWLNEAGQSATGALLDHLIRVHTAGGDPTPALHARIVARVMALRGVEGRALADRLHVLPDFHGNRSPGADPAALGSITGLTLDSDFDSLCRLYWRACVAIALGIRHILETLRQHGYATAPLHVTGGHTNNPLLMELYADATGCATVQLIAEDATLLGSAMVAATAASLYGTLPAAALAMQQPGRTREPDPSARSQYDRDYRIFLELLAQRRAITALE